MHSICSVSIDEKQEGSRATRLGSDLQLKLSLAQYDADNHYSNDPKRCIIGKYIQHAIEWMIKVSISYGTVMFLGGVFVFWVNLGIESVLFVFDELFSKHNFFGALFVFIPQFIIILIIYWKISAQFWKCMVLIWWNKYDDQYIKCMKKISYGMIFRVFVVLIINFCSIYQLLIDSASRRIVYVDDTSLFQNLTKISMQMSGFLCVLYVIISLIWRHLIILKSITTFNELVSFLLLMNKIRLTDWLQACTKHNNNKLNKNKNAHIKCRCDVWFSDNIGNEMLKSYKKKQFRHKINRIQRYQRQSLLGETTTLQSTLKLSGISADSSIKGINIDNNQRKTYILHIICICWYIMEMIYIIMKYSQLNTTLIVCSTLFPLILYYQLLLEQCKVELYDYLTNWMSYPSFRAPLLMKTLIGVWMMMGIIFSCTLVLFRYIDIYKARQEIMNTGVENFKNPIWNFFHGGKPDQFTYPFCQIKEQRDEILDITFLTKCVYSRNVETVKHAMQLYFGGRNDEQWQYIDGVLDKAPVFMHIKNNETKQDIIICRGTSEIRDIYEDFSLYSESLAISGFSKVVPMTELWPQSLLQRLIAIMSITEGIIFKDAKNRHFQAVEQYIYDAESIDLDQYKRSNASGAINVTANNHNNKPFIVAGHSLGGSTAHIVGAKLLNDNQQLLNIKTFGISNPGLVWNAKKFGIKTHLLAQIAVSIQPRLDPIPRFDEHTGSVHHIDCQSPYQEGCHYAEQSFCEMYTSCTTIDEFRRLTDKQQLFLQCLCDFIQPFDFCVLQAMDND